MPKFSVKTELHISTEITVEIDADDADAAIEAVAALLPADTRTNQKGWSASVVLFCPPNGVDIKSIKALAFAHASGRERAKKIG